MESGTFHGNVYQDLIKAKYLPSLWTAQKAAARALIMVILGPLTLEALTRVTLNVHKRMANAPRSRKPQVVYGRTTQF